MRPQQRGGLPSSANDITYHLRPSVSSSCQVTQAWVLLSFVTAFSMSSLDPTLDSAECTCFHDCISPKWQHNGACEWCKPLFSCSRLVLLSVAQFFAHGFDVLISDGGGGGVDILNKHSHPFHTVKHAKLSSRWGGHVEKLWRSCKYKLGGEGK